MPQCFFRKKIFAGTNEIFAGTNTREISEVTLFLVIYTEISNISLHCFFYLPVCCTGAFNDKKSPVMPYLHSLVIEPYTDSSASLTIAAVNTIHPVAS